MAVVNLSADCKEALATHLLSITDSADQITRVMYQYLVLAISENWGIACPASHSTMPISIDIIKYFNSIFIYAF